MGITAFDDVRPADLAEARKTYEAAGDARYLGLVGVLNLVVYAPMLWVIHVFAQDATSAILWIWVAFALGYMAARGVTLSLRAKNTAWMRLGS